MVLPIHDDNPTRRVPVVTVGIILLCVGVYLFVQRPMEGTVDDLRFTYEYAAIPCELTTGEPLDVAEIELGLRGVDSACGADIEGADQQVFPDKQVFLAVIVSMFLHGGLWHLGGNMLFLWVFGNNIEDHLGAVRYLLFYLVSGVVATLGHVVIQVDSTVPVIGASGAVAGVMGAYLAWFPRAPVLSIVGIFPVRVPAFIVLGFWFLSQFAVDANSGVAWMSHVAGFVFGLALGLLVRESVAARRRMWQQRYLDAGTGEWDPRRGGRH